MQNIKSPKPLVGYTISEKAQNRLGAFARSYASALVKIYQQHEQHTGGKKYDLYELVNAIKPKIEEMLVENDTSFSASFPEYEHTIKKMLNDLGVPNEVLIAAPTIKCLTVLVAKTLEEMSQGEYGKAIVLAMADKLPAKQNMANQEITEVTEDMIVND